MQAFTNLKVWRKAHELTLAVYQVTARFPKSELYTLSSQMKRAASSIGANIAEECGRSSDADFTRFLFIAMGSASEFENHLLLARDLTFLSPSEFEDFRGRAQEVKRMLGALISRTKR